MIRIDSEGSFKNLETFLDRMKNQDMFKQLDSAGRDGVAALKSNTPYLSGETAAAWDYRIDISGDKCTITWTNSNVNAGVPIAIILQYGHGTGTGGYVQGRDYINPAMKPQFDKIAEKVWKAVTSA